MHKLLTNIAYKYPPEGRYAVNIMKCIRSVFTEEPIPESSEGISYWHQKEEERGKKRVSTLEHQPFFQFRCHVTTFDPLNSSSESAPLVRKNA